MIKIYGVIAAALVASGHRSSIDCERLLGDGTRYIALYESSLAATLLNTPYLSMKKRVPEAVLALREFADAAATEVAKVAGVDPEQVGDLPLIECAMSTNNSLAAVTYLYAMASLDPDRAKAYAVEYALCRDVGGTMVSLWSPLLSSLADEQLVDAAVTVVMNNDEASPVVFRMLLFTTLEKPAALAAKEGVCRIVAAIEPGKASPANLTVAAQYLEGFCDDARGRPFVEYINAHWRDSHWYAREALRRGSISTDREIDEALLNILQGTALPGLEEEWDAQVIFLLVDDRTLLERAKKIIASESGLNPRVVEVVQSL